MDTNRLKHHIVLLTAVALLMTLPLSAQHKRYHGDGIDDVTRFFPLGAVITMKAIGLESESTWTELLVNGSASLALSCGTTYLLKKTIHEQRPDGTGNDAFPSGHATLAFAGARMLDREYRHLSPWISVAGYTVAGLTAIDRVARNRHRWGDVAVGAAIGWLGTELGYRLGERIMGREQKRYTVAVAPNGLALRIKL